MRNSNISLFFFRLMMDETAVQKKTRLTSITPGWPDDGALGVQLPHSLSEPRTSPLRRSSSSRGQNVQVVR